LKSSFSWFKKPPLDIAAKVPRPVGFLCRQDRGCVSMCVPFEPNLSRCFLFRLEKLTKASFPMERTMFTIGNAKSILFEQSRVELVGEKGPNELGDLKNKQPTERARRASNGGAAAVHVGRGGAHWGNRRILSTIPNPCRSTKGVPPPWAARGGKEGEAGVKTWFRKIDP
jgi:hypothetical protein